MKVKNLMERSGIQETGRALAYLRDGLEELNIISETDIKTKRINIEQNKRFYDLPSDLVQLKSVRVKNHLNSKDEYRNIPRLLYEPKIHDSDGI